MITFKKIFKIYTYLLNFYSHIEAYKIGIFVTLTYYIIHLAYHIQDFIIVLLKQKRIRYA